MSGYAFDYDDPRCAHGRSLQMYFGRLGEVHPVSGRDGYGNPQCETCRAQWLAAEEQNKRIMAQIKTELGRVKVRTAGGWR